MMGKIVKLTCMPAIPSPMFAALLAEATYVEGYNESQREVYSRKLRAGRRTYLFDVRATRGNDYYITITERKRQPDGITIHKQKLFLYKEDLLNFLDALADVTDHLRHDLMPDYDFEQHRYPEEGGYEAEER